MMTTTTPTKAAWDDEDANVVVYGTHDAAEGKTLYTAHLTECGFTPVDEEWDEQADDIAFYEGMTKRWTLPKDDEESFDLLTEPGEGREPYMWASL